MYEIKTEYWTPTNTKGKVNFKTLDRIVWFRMGNVIIDIVELILMGLVIIVCSVKETFDYIKKRERDI